MHSVTDSIGDLLAKRDFEEPPEVRIIKDFVKQRFGVDADVMVQQRQIIISVQGSAQAGALRMHLHQLKKLCASDKRLVIRIN